MRKSTDHMHRIYATPTIIYHHFHVHLLIHRHTTDGFKKKRLEIKFRYVKAESFPVRNVVILIKSYYIRIVK